MGMGQNCGQMWYVTTVGDINTKLTMFGINHHEIPNVNTE